MRCYAGVAEPLIRCVSTGLMPTDEEVDALAERIWLESAPARSAFGWGRLEAACEERRAAVQTAAIALVGASPRVNRRRA